MTTKPILVAHPDLGPGKWPARAIKVMPSSDSSVPNLLVAVGRGEEVFLFEVPHFSYATDREAGPYWHRPERDDEGV